MKEFNLKLTEQDVNIIAVALGEIAFKLAHPLINKLQTQINEQQKERPDATADGSGTV